MTVTQPVDASEAVRARAIIAVLVSAGLTAAIMQTVVIPLIGQFPDLLGSTPAATSWIVTVTLLASAVSTPVTGRLGDLYGNRRVMTACALSLVLGSVLCAVATSLPPMILGRGFQGVGMGIFPLGISTMRDVLPRRYLAGALAAVSASFGVGGAIGKPLAAVIAEVGQWQMVFWVSAVLTAVVALLIVVLLPATPPRGSGRFDAVGAIWMSAGLVALLLGITEAQPLLLAAGAILLVLWGRHQLRRTSPLVDLRSTSSRPLLLTNIAGTMVGATMITQGLLIPQLLQLPPGNGYGTGQSMFAMGMWTLPAGIIMLPFAPIAARVSTRYGARTTLVVGGTVIAAGYLLTLPLLGSVWGLATAAFVVGIGFAFAFGGMPALVLQYAPFGQGGSANGINSLARSLGSTTASAIVGMLLAHLTVHRDGLLLPSRTGFVIGLSIGVVAALAVVALALAIRPDAVPGTRDGVGPDDDAAQAPALDRGREPALVDA